VRGALITKGGPAVPDLAVQRREGISHFAWESDDPVFDTSMALWAHQKGLQVVTQFGPAGSPELTAKFASDEITRLGGGLPGHTPQAQLDVMPDQETSHDPAWFVAFYKAFRKLRTARIVYATLEWHQAGWFSQEMKDEINSDFRFFILPQAYETGQMNPVDPRAVVTDCTQHGINEGDVQVFLRNDRLDIGWSGWCYDYNQAR
jgi:hypothetical protein